METPIEKIARLKSECKKLIVYTRLGHRGDRHHFEDSLVNILSAHKELLGVAREIAEENEKLKIALEKSYSGNIKRILVAEETAKIALGLIAKDKRNA